MNINFHETIKKIKTHVCPPVGSYALESEPPKDVRWDNCLEQFAAKFKDNTIGFYFSHLSGKSLDIGSFLTKFENILNIKDTSFFSKTEKQNILWIEPSDFWKNCQIKRSLLTIIIRCGMNYNFEKDNFDDALFGQYKETVYVKETRSAILRFMFGFTKFNGTIKSIIPKATVIKHGWREEFVHSDDFLVRKKLILPEGRKEEKNIIGLESLWI
jgi:hypothetical protein